MKGILIVVEVLVSFCSGSDDVWLFLKCRCKVAVKVMQFDYFGNDDVLLL